MFWKRKKKENPYQELRGMALGATSEELRIAPDFGKVWGCVVEFQVALVPVSLVVFAEGTVSLYLGSGGGFIGCGQHEAVRSEGFRLLKAVEANLDLFQKGDDGALPQRGEVLIHARTFDGPMSSSAPQKALASKAHPLAGIFYVANDVITQVRLHSQGR